MLRPYLHVCDITALGKYLYRIYKLFRGEMKAKPNFLTRVDVISMFSDSRSPAYK